MICMAFSLSVNLPLFWWVKELLHDRPSGWCSYRRGAFPVLDIYDKSFSVICHFLSFFCCFKICNCKYWILIQLWHVFFFQFMPEFVASELIGNLPTGCSWRAAVRCRINPDRRWIMYLHRSRRRSVRHAHLGADFFVILDRRPGRPHPPDPDLWRADLLVKLFHNRFVPDTIFWLRGRWWGTMTSTPIFTRALARATTSSSPFSAPHRFWRNQKIFIYSFRASMTAPSCEIFFPSRLPAYYAHPGRDNRLSVAQVYCGAPLWLIPRRPECPMLRQSVVNIDDQRHITELTIHLAKYITRSPWPNPTRQTELGVAGRTNCHEQGFKPHRFGDSCRHCVIYHRQTHKLGWFK